MPKRSFASIRTLSDLRNSRVYGDGNVDRYSHKYVDPMKISIHNRGIVGYTGHNEARNVPVQAHLLQHGEKLPDSLPGYTGYIPGVRSESIFGKSIGSIISAYTKRSCKS